MSHVHLPSKGMVIIAGNSHSTFASMVANYLGTSLGKCCVYYKTSRETRVNIEETVRGRDVFIIQTGTENVNNDVMETMILCYACKTADARSVNVAMPYLPYSKQSKMRKRGSIVSQLIARMLCRCGITHFITIDLHATEIQGFFDVPVDNLRASPFLIQYIQECILEYGKEAVIVARTPATVAKATSYAERLDIRLAVIHGEIKEGIESDDDGRASPPPASSDDDQPSFCQSPISILPMSTCKEKPPINLVGDVEGRIAIIIEDLIDNVDQFNIAADLLHNQGAIKICVVATHGLLCSEAPEKLANSHIDEVVVTNTIPNKIPILACNKIKIVDVSPLLAEALRRIHNKESMSYLFKNVPRND